MTASLLTHPPAVVIDTHTKAELRKAIKAAGKQGGTYFIPVDMLPPLAHQAEQLASMAKSGASFSDHESWTRRRFVTDPEWAARMTAWAAQVAERERIAHNLCPGQRLAA